MSDLEGIAFRLGITFMVMAASVNDPWLFCAGFLVIWFCEA
jgi:hypothetical protein